jgi:methionine sulfoxide reductase heme-binding subunit
MMNWILIRSAGIGAYLMLYLAVAWGLAATTTVVSNRVSKQASILFHQFTASAGLVLLLIHMGLLLIDKFERYSVLDEFIPLHSHGTHPIAVTMGVIGMYGVVLVMVTSWLRKPLGTQKWRMFHLAAVPAYTLALAHGVFTGYDTPHTWMWMMYALTGTSVLFLLFVRALTYGYREPRAVPERAARPAAGPRSTGGETPAEAARRPVRTVGAVADSFAFDSATPAPRPRPPSAPQMEQPTEQPMDQQELAPDLPPRPDLDDALEDALEV